MGSVDVELESDSDFEEWLPSVLKRWAAFEGGEGNAKRYTAFLRFVFKAYSIPARVYTRWMGRKRRCQTIQVRYYGRARTMEEMQMKHEEIWEIISRFRIPPALEYNYDINYNTSLIWERKTSNGPAYLRMVMCVGKGTIPYMTPELRMAITSS